MGELVPVVSSELTLGANPWDGSPLLDKAEAVIEFIESLKLSTGAAVGKPFLLRDWQKAIIYDLIGVPDIFDPYKRAARTAVITMARKNGKTEFAAALCLAFLCGPLADVSQQIYSAAADRYQAALIFRAMESMILQDEELTAVLRIVSSTKHIFHDDSNSFYAALSSDAKTKHGFNPVFFIYDELAQAPNRVLYDVLSTATGAQAEPLALVISTQSADDHSIMSELVDYGLKVNAGDIDDPTFRLFYFAVEENEDPWDEKLWYKANPGLDDFRSLEEMRQFALRAKRVPSMEATFRNLYLNQRIDATVHFLTPTVWRANRGELTPEQLYDSLLGLMCYGGLDLSQKNDLTALVLVFPLGDDYYATLPYFWTPRDTMLDREDKDKVPYSVWEQQGYLIAKPGKTIDYGWVAQQYGELSKDFDIQAVAFDRWRIDDFKREADNLGIDINLVPHGQGFKDMNPAVEVLEDVVSEYKLQHAGHPVLTWNVSNTVVEMSPAGDRKFAKNKSTGRIDGTVALGMALRVAVTEGETYSSTYEKEGLLMLSG